MLDIPLPIPTPSNEPVLSYAPGTRERAELKAAIAKMRGECPDVPHVVGGKELHDGATFDVREPHAHAKVRAKCHAANEATTERAIAAALAAAPAWAATPFEERARVFLRAADLLAGPWRQILNAATVLGQSKTAIQAEIDSACELVDFFRFNVHYASKLAEQPLSSPGIRNALELRPLEGFVLALTPFNFTAIAGNLPASPALLGNVVVWKPAETQGLAAYHLMRLFEAAGLPPGVINVVYGDGALVSRTCLASRHFAGLHFTGSTTVFRSLMKQMADRMDHYASYPRVVGETGGKDFVVAHASADEAALAVGLVRGAFEFQGQKCSAASRAYVPRSMWPRLWERLRALVDGIKMGDPTDFTNFMGAVISERSYDRLHGWLERLRADKGCTLHGQPWSKSEGYFAGPTIARVDDPNHPLLNEELFGPVLGVYVYDDAKYEETLALVDATSPYGLTGSVFARDRAAVALAARRLRQAAGNFYVNDKPTGAVVGQQPFGGGRASGTNDKAGSAYNLLRWASPRVVKETFVSPTDIGYPHMQPD